MMHALFSYAKQSYPIAMIAIAVLLLGFFSTALLAQDVRPSSDILHPEEAEDSAVLNELGKLANNLERQKRFNSILHDQIDILSHRIDQLEEKNREQAEQLSAILDSKKERKGTAVTPKAGKQPQAPDEAPQAKDKDALPEDFEQFLDMGEAMIRRFFGVVKEFRREFEENRA